MIFAGRWRLASFAATAGLLGAACSGSGGGASHTPTIPTGGTYPAALTAAKCPASSGLGAVPVAPFAPYSFANRLVRSVPGSVATRSVELLGHHVLDLAAATSIVGGLGVGFALGRRSAASLAGLAFPSFVHVR